jgi:NADH:ubiquinone oxidoreductase subunit B-like Fe-S oxidoreductase
MTWQHILAAQLFAALQQLPAGVACSCVELMAISSAQLPMVRWG